MIRAETDGSALASNSGSAIRAYVERINRLREDRDALSADIADEQEFDIYLSAYKSAGG